MRLNKALPVINHLGNWLVGQIDVTLPKSPIGKAVRYAVRLLDELQAYIYDGRLEIDNNLKENAIRPAALGHKNWLFAGSHDAAQNIAMYLSFFGTCHLNGIKPYDWLRYVLENIRSTPADQYHTLLPNLVDPALLKQ
ncbi:MAG: transposase [Bradyrhizobiaceae bacterium]|nr:transposase [Bradyrhizobiaceae bacterium]